MHHQSKSKHEEKVASRLPSLTLPAVINQRQFQALTITKIDEPGSADLVQLQITGKQMTKNDPCLVRPPRTSALPRLGGALNAHCLPTKTPLRCIRRGSSWTTSFDHLQVSKIISQANYRNEIQCLVEHKEIITKDDEEEKGVDESASKSQPETAEIQQNDNFVCANDTQQAPTGKHLKARKDNVFRYEVQLNKLLLIGRGCSNLIYKRWNSSLINEVDTLIFANVDFDEISPHLDKLNSIFHHLTNLEFHRTNICNLLQISLIGSVVYLHSLTLSEEENPIIELSIWRRYAIYRINSLKWLNGKLVTAAEVDEAGQLFRGLPGADKSPAKTYRSHLQKQQSIRSKSIHFEDEDDHLDPNGEIARSSEISSIKYQCPSVAVKSLLEKVRENVTQSLTIHNLCQYYYPKVVEEIVTEAMNDFANMDEHMRICMEKFNAAKLKNIHQFL